MNIPAPRFTVAELEAANSLWGANCGPGALAAILGMTLEQVRPHLGDFERKGYTNPTLMYAALKSAIPCRYHTKNLRTAGKAPWDWPRYGLCRVQWEGPWTEPGVPMRARYRHTHWIGCAAESNDNIGVFDVNALGEGATGWVSLANWKTILVPWILESCVRRASGGWHLTHAIEIETGAGP